MNGTTLGKYDVLEEIGRGGMAVVYRGYDRELEREVAIKILHPHLSSQPESKRRFHREARAVARLRFPNILEIFDYSGKDSEQAYIVTEFIHGATLRTFFEAHAEVPTEVAALIALEVCRGLHHAHQNSVIHRDIKPENIMIRDDGVVKITDFGIAQMAGTTQMTMTGQILGSPAHMSPEHVENKPLDFRADIFSMGTLIYWMAAGRLPFEGRNPHAVIKRIVEGDYPDPLRIKPAMGVQMAAIIRRCLEVDPDCRFQTVDELIVDLEAFVDDLGLPTTGQELRTYFADPEGYAARHRAALLETLIRRGKEEKKARCHQKAIDYFNRVLSLDETNEEVLSLVERMTARNRLRKGIEAAAVIVTVLAVAGGVAYELFGGFGGWGRGDGRRGDGAVTALTPVHDAGPAPAADAEAGPETPDAAAPPPVDGPRHDASTADAGKAPARDGGGEPERHPGAVVAARPRLVRLVPDPPTARLVVDGRDRGEYGSELAKGIELEPGSHRVVFIPVERPDDECRYDRLEVQLYVPEAAPGGELLRRTYSLPFRPAAVLISSKAPGATVSVQGRARWPANEVHRLRLNQCRERVTLLVDADGYRPVALEDVVLQSGGEYSRAVHLEPEPQASALENTTTP